MAQPLQTIRRATEVATRQRRKGTMIKKIYAAIMMAIMLGVAIPAFSGTAVAQRRDGRDRGTYRYDERYRDRNRGTVYNDPYYNDGYYQGYEQPNVYDRHRKAINLGVATGAGALIGALIGGKKGAIIGAAAGVATGAIVTAKQKPRNTERYRY